MRRRNSWIGIALLPLAWSASAAGPTPSPVPRAADPYLPYRLCHLSLSIGLKSSDRCDEGLGAAAFSDDDDLRYLAGTQRAQRGVFLYTEHRAYFFRIPTRFPSENKEQVFRVSVPEGAGEDLYLVCWASQRSEQTHWCRSGEDLLAEARKWRKLAEKDPGAAQAAARIDEYLRAAEKVAIKATPAARAAAARVFGDKLLACAREYFSGGAAEPATPLPGETELQYLTRDGLGSCKDVLGGGFFTELRKNLGVRSLLQKAPKAPLHPPRQPSS